MCGLIGFLSATGEAASVAAAVDGALPDMRHRGPDESGVWHDDDVAIEKDGATVLIDDLSLVYMGGSVIDFVDDLMGQSFQIRNPNAVASCGCGTSFSI